MFRNIEGQRFEQVQSAWNLDDPVNTPSYTYVDLDLDGDLDIIATGVLASPRIYLNELQVGNSVSFVLIDKRGNSSAIGAKITIYFAASRQSQRKENKLSGGFLSFDNPVIHFGLGEEAIIDQISVRWPDGEESVIDGPLVVSGIYRVIRLGQR